MSFLTIELPVPPLVLLGLLGLLVGSFLNVVIHRYPKMLERQWRRDSRAFLQSLENSADEAVKLVNAGDEKGAASTTPEAPYNLLTPRSACPACQAPIQWWQNIPVLSYLFLKGRCAGCKTPITVRYPLVELLTAGVFAAVGQRYGLSLAGAFWAGAAAICVALAFIDYDTTLLPDDMVYPLLWGGLLASLLGYSGVPLSSAVWGAMAGYLSLWSVYWLFKLVTGKEGMGYGDFKLLAALGAWLGVSAVLPIVLVASVCGAVVGLLLKALGKAATPAAEAAAAGYIPFGPFLILGGAVVWAMPSLMDQVLRGLAL